MLNLKKIEISFCYNNLVYDFLPKQINMAGDGGGRGAKYFSTMILQQYFATITLIIIKN